MKMERRHHQQTVTIASSANLSGAFDFTLYAMGVLHMPATWTAASIGFKVAPTEAGTYQALYDDNGSLVQIDSPAVSKSYAFPPETSACRWMKLWSQNGSGTDTTQAQEDIIGLSLKA